MKKNLLFALSIAVFALLFSTFAFAQDERVVTAAAGDMYVISAKAGGVNFVEGKVNIVRQDGKSGFLLKRDEIAVGDKISTGADGKTEILLNPGSYVRLGANAVFEFQSTDLDNLQLKLSGGSAIFEVYADKEFKVTLDLPDADIELTKSGVYRVDVLSDGSGKISVLKGKVIVGDEEIKAGRFAIVKGKNAKSIAKFDRDSRDALDIWSDERAKQVTAVNKRLQRNALTQSLLNSYNLGNWNMFSSFGVWVLDPLTGWWCFLPFGQGWRSPYGYNYSYNIYSCPLPPVVWTPPTTNTPSTPTNGNPITPQQAQIIEERRQTMHTPTFQRFENNQRNETRGNGSRNDSSNNSDNSSNSGGWRNDASRSDSSDSRSTPSQSTPSQPTPAQTAPIITPSRTETKDPKID